MLESDLAKGSLPLLVLGDLPLSESDLVIGRLGDLPGDPPLATLTVDPDLDKPGGLIVVELDLDNPGLTPMLVVEFDLDSRTGMPEPDGDLDRRGEGARIPDGDLTPACEESDPYRAGDGFLSLLAGEESRPGPGEGAG